MEILQIFVMHAILLVLLAKDQQPLIALPVLLEVLTQQQELAQVVVELVNIVLLMYVIRVLHIVQHAHQKLSVLNVKLFLECHIS